MQNIIVALGMKEECRLGKADDDDGPANRFNFLVRVMMRRRCRRVCGDLGGLGHTQRGGGGEGGGGLTK